MSKFLLISLLLFLPVASGASQFVAATVEQIAFIAKVEDPDTLVKVEAVQGGKTDDTPVITISYKDHTITIPSKVLRKLPDLKLDSLRLSFCGQPLTDEISAEHPCLALFIDYGAPYSIEGQNIKFPFISVEIHEGSIIHYVRHWFDGNEWQDENVL